jgi:hypothetical protein
MNIDDVLKSHGIGVGGGSNIKNSYSGKSTLAGTEATKTITISPVNTSKSIIRYRSYTRTTGSAYNTANNICLKVEFVNSTTIKVTRVWSNNTDGSQVSLDFTWDVIEFNNVKSKQAGVLNPTTNLTNIGVSNVNVSKTLLFDNLAGGSGIDVTNNSYQSTLTSETNIEVRFIGMNAQIYQWQLIEFN